jgi:DNA-binding MarR family transcriptional regulator
MWLNSRCSIRFHLEVPARSQRLYCKDVNHECTGGRPAGVSDAFDLIERLARKLQHAQRQVAGRTGLSSLQYVVIGALGERDRRPLKELAEVAHCTRAAVTGIVDALESKGLVMREPNADDRRSVLLALTPQGRALLDSAPRLAELFRGCCDGLSPDEVERLTALLTRLDRSLGAWDLA